MLFFKFIFVCFPCDGLSSVEVSMEPQHNTSLYHSLRTFSYVELISADQFVNSFECEMLAHISSDIHMWMHNHMVTCLGRIQMYCCWSDTDFLVIRYPYFWRRVSSTRFLVVIDHLWRCVPWHNFLLFLWVNWTAHWLDHSIELASCWDFSLMYFLKVIIIVILFFIFAYFLKVVYNRWCWFLCSVFVFGWV